jgi:DNA-binding protein H-NS
VIEKMRAELEQAGIDPDAINVSFGRKRARKDRGSTLPPKYRSPEGETWSGRGHAPLWIRQLELQGHSREEYATFHRF